MTNVEEIKEAIAVLYKHHQNPEMIRAMLEDTKFEEVLREAKYNYRFGRILENICETESINGSDLEDTYQRILMPIARSVLRAHNSLDENPEEWELGGKLTILNQLQLIVSMEEKLKQWKNELKSIINEKI
ncbi:MAG: hypothetical protein ACI4S2_06715 [Lachnospiraceae bacterium]